MDNKLFKGGKRCLGVGCGRGTISAYFSDAGYNCTLLDSSEAIINRAKNIFALNNLKGEFIVGNANNLYFKDNPFDVVVSIGLLEHFIDIEPPIREQIRVLDKGGIFLGYVVPNFTNKIQKEYEWIIQILKGYIVSNLGNSTKEKVFRSGKGSAKYI